MSDAVILQMVARVLKKRHRGGGTLLDIGCGRGDLRSFVSPLVQEYVGVDVVRYPEFPEDAAFVKMDLDSGQVPFPAASADVVAAVETIEHLENPRAFFRELKRLVKPGGIVIVTTPNQLCFLSLLTLFTKRQFNAFQEAPGLYPAHITALLEIDLIRIAGECGLSDGQIEYSHQGRIPLTPWYWPAAFKGRTFSDNLLISAIG
jgi:2-polyprenyl-3-methyl-5-hydroxy-6-metoxy-1,4-benzoquinol methylase